MNKAGAPQTEGLNIQNGAFLREKCLKICKNYAGPTACEYTTEGHECRIHTSFVKVTTGEVPHYIKSSCFLFGMYFQAQPQLNSYSIQFNFNNQCLVASELQKDFFRLVFGFSTKKCQNDVFTEFCQKIMHIIEQMLVLFSLSLIGS